MHNTRPLHILVIDDDPNVRRDLGHILSKTGYEIRVVEGVGQALLGQAILDARSFRPHVAIVDLRLLDDANNNDQSGLVLFETLHSLRCILYSAYFTPQLVRKALAAGVASVVGKSESPQQLLDAIIDVARKVYARQTSLSVHLPPAWTPQRIVRALFGEASDVPAGIVGDVLCQLFRDRKTTVRLEVMGGAAITPGSVHRGRSVVMKAWLANRKEPLIVKLAPAGRIVEEGRNYYDIIKGNLRGQFHAAVEGQPATFWDLGGILYSFIGGPREGLPSFAKFYKEQRDPQVILQPLRDFFDVVWCDLYRDATVLERPLFAAYDKVLRLENALSMFPETGREIVYPGVSTALPNPVSWVLRHTDDSAIPHTHQAITHGDLHADNLFVDGHHAWAIDFERSGMGPILRDFVELEVDIVTRLTSFPLDNLSGLCEMAIMLAGPSDPASPIPSTARLLRNSETRKALEIVSELRKLAYRITRYSDAREYLWGLLMDCLFVASLIAEEYPQQQRALLLASVICERLRRWGEEWPPPGWLVTTHSRKRLPHGTVPVQSEPSAAAAVLEHKIAAQDFDVFLCHNSHDKPAVKVVAAHLKQRGILPWLDEWELRPGHAWQGALEERIADIRSAAVFVGENGIGPWQDMEQAAFIRQFVKRGCPVIPVILPDCNQAPELPIFLEGMTWVDFRKQDPDPLTHLIWGITGNR